METPDIVATPPGSAPRLIATNTAWRLAAFGGRTVGGVLATVLVARLRGPSGLGQYQFALNLTLLLSFLVMLGLPKLLVRDLARAPDLAGAWVDTALFATSTAGIVFTALVFGIAEGVGADPVLLPLLVMAGLALTVDAAARVVMALFWAHERMQYEAVTVGVQEGAFVAGTLIALVAGHGVAGVMLAYLLSRMVGMWMAWFVAARKFDCRVWPRLHPGVLAPMLRRMVPFAADDGLSLAYIRLDVVLLGFFKGVTAVGLYQAATNLVLYLNVLPRMLNMSLYPRMSRAWPHRPDELGRLRDASLRVVGAVAMPITVGSFLFAPRVFALVYGSGFDRAVLCYRLLVPIIPIRMLGNTLGTALTSADRQTRRTVAVGIAAAANVLLNLFFIPRWSYLGAAGTTLITETGLFIGYAILLRQATGPSRVVSALVIPGIACLPMAVAAAVLASAPLAVAVAASAGAYLVGLFCIATFMMPVRTLHPRMVMASFLQGPR